MPFHSNGEIDYYQFDLFDQSVLHAIFLRRGGISPTPWQSLNMGSTVGDDIKRVRENRRLGLTALSRHPDSVFEAWQVHGIEVAIGESPSSKKSPIVKADIIITDRPGLTLMMRFADCVPIILHDPIKRVIGIAHAGWMGTVLGTACYAVKAMQTHYGSSPSNIQAAIGPSIGPDHYEVGPEVVEEVKRSFGTDASGLLSTKGSSVNLDLWSANALLLGQAGIRNIEIARLCTACHPGDWYSHRAENGTTGRFGAIIALV